MVEIRGKEIRLSKTKGPLQFEVGQKTKLVGAQFKLESDVNCLRISTESVFRFLKSRDVIYLDDGKVVATVDEASETECTVTVK